MTNVQSDSKSILEMTHVEAKTFLLKSKSYCSTELPPYFCFDSLLAEIDNGLSHYKFSDIIEKPEIYENVNYTIYDNKDGKYAWRPIQLIHPVFYTGLVNLITDEDNWKIIINRFTDFNSKSVVSCLSMPKESLSVESDKAIMVDAWWSGIEQQSIEASLDFDFMALADITDCYGSFYTHTISWALHDKEVAKNSINDYTYLGNKIDRFIRQMSNGQTNGIPQGSVLMDFFAELLLAYIDVTLSEKINKDFTNVKYKIIRYRDDYRIFAEHSYVAERILKMLTETLIEFGLKLNTKKTSINSNIISSSIKEDKLKWITKVHRSSSIQKTLLIIHQHAEEYNNSGSLVRALSEFYQFIEDKRLRTNDISPLISILVDIGYNNPKSFPMVAAIISLVFLKLDLSIKKDLFKRIQTKFDKKPNTGFIQIWLQRIVLSQMDNISFSEPICQIVSNSTCDLWNNDWVKCKKIRNLIEPSKIVKRDLVASATEVIKYDEIALFIKKAGEQYI